MKIDNNKSVYNQIADDIKKDIYNGVFIGNEMLPSIREMSSKYNVTPRTIQNAYEYLQEENIIIKKQGVGVFVTDDKDVIEKSKTESLKRLNDYYIDKVKELNIDIKDAIKKHRSNY